MTKRETKGQRTRARIVKEAAELFNVRGYSGTSVSDVSSAVGLEKGGVYNHFESKDALALACFDYAAGAVLTRIRDAAAMSGSAWQRIEAVLDIYRNLADHRSLKGGCPILNTAIEADDTHPALSAKARRALDTWRTIVTGILEDGVRSGELRPASAPRDIATTVVAAIEGAIMITNVHRDSAQMRTVVDQLTAYLRAVLNLPAA
jgi:TetR/AcrR family transcriptional regulator, transcriptional repressor for nem operon